MIAPGDLRLPGCLIGRRGDAGGGYAGGVPASDARARPGAWWSAGRRARRPAVTSRSGTPASDAVVINACRSVCGPAGAVIPARRATRRAIRPAPCRSRPCPFTARKTWSFAALADGQVDGPRGPRRERDGDDRAALTGDDRGPVAALDAGGLDVRAGGLADPQAVDGPQADQGMPGGRAGPGGGQQCADLVAVQAGGVRLIIQAGPADMHCRGTIQQFLPGGVPAGTPATVHSRRVMAARARPRAPRSRAKHAMPARRTLNRRR